MSRKGAQFRSHPESRGGGGGVSAVYVSNQLIVMVINSQGQWGI